MKIKSTRGVYIIKNLINEKVYIGQASNMSSRVGIHKWQLRNNKHWNPYLQNAWNKYGEENFEFSILRECSKEDVDQFEKFFIKEYDSEHPNGYNLMSGGKDGFTYGAGSKTKMGKQPRGKQSDETIKKKERWI